MEFGKVVSLGPKSLMGWIFEVVLLNNGMSGGFCKHVCVRVDVKQEQINGIWTTYPFSSGQVDVALRRRFLCRHLRIFCPALSDSVIVEILRHEKLIQGCESSVFVEEL